MQLARSLPATLGYRPGLDGLRGIAITFVLLAHGGLIAPWMGPTGVTIFFVLSGFLITRLLIDERHSTGRISLRGFYLRRARRLLPALVVMVGVVTLIRPDAWSGALWSMTYISNWAILGGLNMPLFEHTWSLAIEEQFYLVWPLAFVLLGIGRWTAPVIGGMAVVCVAVRLVPMDPQALAYSTVTQAPALLLGVLLSFVRLPSAWRPLWIAAASVVLLAALGQGQVWRDPLTAIAAALFIVPAYHGAFAWRPLVGLGRISYGVYLWQTPVLILSGAFLGEAGTLASLVAIAATIGIAAVSYLLVEQPIRRWRPVRSPAKSQAR